ncbi:hypothetical protein Hypma_014633 [Hypsizygus marmoreus]|uniref:Uncharacterized protein n=1 Tax=Hypsizygus marmoreus TaxID=39966 RepID=A0A369JG04_HYPMA|nr:hypothetical protein Hypma_014633 [Hypsizygus marmoreus]
MHLCTRPQDSHVNPLTASLPQTPYRNLSSKSISIWTQKSRLAKDQGTTNTRLKDTTLYEEIGNGVEKKERARNHERQKTEEASAGHV